MKIEIPGIPVPQGRLRYCYRGKAMQLYDPTTPQKNVIKRQISQHVKRFYNDHPMFIHPRISFAFVMPIPKSTTKKVRAKYLKNVTKHEHKPDVDNLVKLYLDCLDGIIFEGDQAVSLGPCVKVYGEKPQTIVWISETTQTLSVAEVSPEIYCKICDCINQTTALEPDFEKNYLHDSGRSAEQFYIFDYG